MSYFSLLVNQSGLHLTIGELIWEDWTHCDDETKTGISIEGNNERYYFPPEFMDVYCNSSQCERDCKTIKCYVSDYSIQSFNNYNWYCVPGKYFSCLNASCNGNNLTPTLIF